MARYSIIVKEKLDEEGNARLEIDEHKKRLNVCRSCKSKSGYIDYELGQYRIWCKNCGRHTKPFDRVFQAVKAWNGGATTRKI